MKNSEYSKNKLQRPRKKTKWLKTLATLKITFNVPVELPMIIEMSIVLVETTSYVDRAKTLLIIDRGGSALSHLSTHVFKLVLRNSEYPTSPDVRLFQT